MTRQRMVIPVLVAVVGLCGAANAALTTIGTAQYGAQNYKLIWDNDSPFGSIVWLDYTKSADTWANQVAWANGLNSPGTLTYAIDPLYSVTWGGDWRLPATVDGLYVYGYDGTTTGGYNITSSEMGHLYYTELGNKGFVATDGTFPQPGWGLQNSGPFTDLHAGAYWSATEYSLDSGLAWGLSFGGGVQGNDPKNSSFYYALAVRPAEAVAIPEPASMVLAAIGLAGVGACRRRIAHRQG